MELIKSPTGQVDVTASRSEVGVRAGRFVVVWGSAMLGGAHESRAWQIAEEQGTGFTQAAAAVVFESGGDLLSGGALGSNQIVIRRHASGDGSELWRFAVSGTTWGSSVGASASPR